MQTPPRSLLPAAAFTVAVVMLLPGCTEHADDGDGTAAPSPRASTSAAPSASASPSALAGNSTATANATAPSASAAAKEPSPYGDFGQQMKGAAHAMLSAAQGKKADAKWGLASAKALPRSDRLADAKMSLASVNVEAKGPHGYLRWNLMVTPAGQVQFVNAIQLRKPRANAAENGQPLLFANFVNHTLASLSNGECRLPLFDSGSFTDFPPRFARQAKKLEKESLVAVARACRKMLNKGEGYKARLIDIRVVMLKGGAPLRLLSRFRVEDGKLRLEPPRWR